VFADFASFRTFFFIAFLTSLLSVRSGQLNHVVNENADQDYPDESAGIANIQQS
jgi:hypothetical protein